MATRNALELLENLAAFYHIQLWNPEMWPYDDDASDSTCISVRNNPEGYLELLLLEWGMKWVDVKAVGLRYMEEQPTHAGIKRSNHTADPNRKRKDKRAKEDERQLN